MKKYLPYVSLAGLIIVLGGAWYYFSSTAPAAPIDTATTTEATSTGTGAGSFLPELPLGNGTPSKSSGATVVSKTIWVDHTNDQWDLLFKYQPTWQVYEMQDDSRTDLSFSTGSIIISKGTRIAEPSNHELTITSRTIAGQKLEVHRYNNPSDKYAYYEYVTIEAKNVKYYIFVKSTQKENRAVEDFYGFVTTRK